jgi:hypothetical protein
MFRCVLLSFNNRSWLGRNGFLTPHDWPAAPTSGFFVANRVTD